MPWWLHVKIQLFWNDFKIISEFYFTCNHVWNWNKIILADEEEVLKSFQNYFSDNIYILEIYLWNKFEINFRQLSTRWNEIISDGRRRRLK